MSSEPPRDAKRGSADAPPDDHTLIGGASDTLAPAGRLGGGHEWVGRRLGRYHLTAVIGGGGMGVVYRARDEVIERDVAVKVLPPELAGDPTALSRFLSEARTSGRLSHPNAVTLYEVGEQDATHFLVMELVTGGSLAEEVRRIGPLSPLAATRAVAEAARGLAAAHAAGMVHRDVKPANLLRTADGHVKVCDFGLAKEAFSDRGVTKAGFIVGTPYFMSPEQCQGQPVDARSDVYSLGATYFFLLTGAEPYSDSGSTMQVMYAHCHGAPLDPRQFNALVPEQCAAVALRATARDPAERYASAAEMLRDLEAALSGMSGNRSGSQVRLGMSAADASRFHAATGSATRLTPAAVAEAAPARRQTGARRWLAALGAIAAIAAVAIIIALSRGGGGVRPGAGAAGGAAAATSKPGDAAAAGRSPPTPAGEPIRVGVLHSLSGNMAASESPVVDAVLLAIDEVNRAGGVLGRPVEPVVADGRSDPQVFLREATRLIDGEKVPVVFGCWTSPARKTVIPLFEDRDHLLIYPAQHEGLEESPNVFYTGATPNQQILPAVAWAVEALKAKRLFIVGTDSVFPRAAAAIVKDAAPAAGVEIVGEEYLPYGARSAGAVAALVAAEKPDAILNFISGDANVTLFNALRRAEVRPEQTPTISFSIGEEGLRALDPSDIAGDYAAWNYFQSIDSPENRAFLASFRGRYGPQRTVTDPMEAAYVGLKLWAAAANETHSVEPRPVRAALRGLRLNAPEGPVRVEATSQHLFRTPRVGRVGDDGRFALVWSAPKPVPPEPYPHSRSAEQWKAFLRDLQRDWGGQWTAPAN